MYSLEITSHKYTIMVKSKIGVFRYPIMFSGDKYYINSEDLEDTSVNDGMFNSVVELINTYKDKPFDKRSTEDQTRIIDIKLENAIVESLPELPPGATPKVQGGPVLYRPLYAGPIDYKVSEPLYDHQLHGVAFYYNLTLLDGENKGAGTTVKIVVDSKTGNKSTDPMFKRTNVQVRLPQFKTLDAILDFYKEQTFTYKKGMDQSGDVTLRNLID